MTCSDTSLWAIHRPSGDHTPSSAGKPRSPTSLLPSESTRYIPSSAALSGAGSYRWTCQYCPVDVLPSHREPSVGFDVIGPGQPDAVSNVVVVVVTGAGRVVVDGRG